MQEDTVEASIRLTPSVRTAKGLAIGKILLKEYFTSFNLDYFRGGDPECPWSGPNHLALPQPKPPGTN